jgi:hypothetical protein
MVGNLVVGGFFYVRQGVVFVLLSQAAGCECYAHFLGKHKTKISSWPTWAESSVPNFMLV